MKITASFPDLQLDITSNELTVDLENLVLAENAEKKKSIIRSILRMGIVNAQKSDRNRI